MVETNEKCHGERNFPISTVVMNYLKKQRVHRAAISLPEFALFSRRSRLRYAKYLRAWVYIYARSVRSAFYLHSRYLSPV